MGPDLSQSSTGQGGVTCPAELSGRWLALLYCLHSFSGLLPMGPGGGPLRTSLPQSQGRGTGTQVPRPERGAARWSSAQKEPGSSDLCEQTAVPWGSKGLWAASQMLLGLVTSGFRGMRD